MRLMILTALFAACNLQAEMKIAVIDLEKTVNNVTDGQAAKVKLQEEFKKKQELLDSKQAELKKLQESFQSKAAVMTEQARQEKGMELQTKFGEAQQLYATMQEEMVKKQRDVMGDIIKKANPIIQDIAKAEGYSVVLNKNEATVLYVTPELDITNTVIKRYNTANPVKAKNQKTIKAK
ncbi:MAG: OmpH family outer membrane protein [Myxococcota bacterium]